jgi:hypothetical protein
MSSPVYGKAVRHGLSRHGALSMMAGIPSCAGAGRSAANSVAAGLHDMVTARDDDY